MKNQNTKTAEDEYEKHAHALGAAIVSFGALLGPALAGLLLAGRSKQGVVLEIEKRKERPRFTLAELASEFRCDVKTVKRRMKRHGIREEQREKGQMILVSLAEVRKLRAVWGK